MSWTDDELKKLEKQLYDMYHEAGVGLTLKGREFLADLQQKDEWRRKQVADGEWTEEQYKEWRRNKLLYAAKFKRLTETIKRELLEVNQKAIQILNGETPRIFAHNYNSVIESFPDSPVEGYTFELVDAETVKKLARSGELMLPPKKKFDPEKDKAWNGKQLNAQILQGILQGESIPKIAARMADICDGNGKAMVRTARTMVTAAENSGRIAGMNKAEESGMVFEKIWISAVDSRTRDTHIALNGTKVKNGEMFRTFLGNELEFPGDWRAPGFEVYNCRCTLGTHFIGFNRLKGRENIKKAEEVPNNNITEQQQQQTRSTKGAGKLITALENGGLVEFNEVQSRGSARTEQEIINALSGGDRTRGSCASVGLAYIGQKQGWDVLDFRDGKSREFFSRSVNLLELSRTEGVSALHYGDVKGQTSCTLAANFLKECEIGKEYYLCVGRHASIVRRVEDDGKKPVYEYLELQSATSSGWTKFDGNPRYTLSRRFGCPTTSGRGEELDFMINITDSDFNTNEFKELLGYINTTEDKQRKGSNGSIK